jgi:tRNA-dihydrouridine synthase
VIRAAKQGAPNIPVSVKTRLGYDSDELETWLPELLAENPAVITIHARTRKEMSLVPARWERVKRAVEIRDEIQKNRKDKTLIFGNGDVEGIDDAKIKVAESGADGAMLGRAIFGNPWVFTGTIPTIDQKLLVMLEHTELFEELLGDVKNFAVMKKHYKAYVQGFEGAAELRARLMETKNAAEVQTIVHAWLETHQLDKSR